MATSNAAASNQTDAVTTNPNTEGDKPLKIAVVGAGPAGIYASDILIKKTGGNVDIDLLDRMPSFRLDPLRRGTGSPAH